ncbi:HlyD family efflux transporter periplasmic adaptor subunit [Methylobacterium sp. J-030]|uniref:efflux RND transporter periplasmic adaptor subunit n=1 Tax=Methylobacterium sp. J-030 TaxID=2836627 RepID=UPI001FB99582|nr:HlyD family efflux transporter periplasmic adaptor subunit [Methylobacterium sp. J-030]MCJ2067707.1 HlyD family efflux transporter periplasmic adaptor subunit [Methylobacterium sp. J-030]
MTEPTSEVMSAALPPIADGRRKIGAPPRVRRAAAGVCAAAIVALAGLAWLRGAPRLGSVELKAVQPVAERTLTVAPVAAAAFVTLAGTVGAEKAVPVVAPFDGAIRAVRKQIGNVVQAGDPLVVMDDGEIATRVREAQAAFLKSSIAADLLHRWADSPEVIRAKRTLESAEAGLALAERQVTETKTLFDRGIVSRNEYDGLVQQRDTQKKAVASAGMDLQTTLARGDANSRRLAALDLQNTRSRLMDVMAQADGKVVCAPIGGILSHPPVSRQTNQPAAEIASGVHVGRGQALFAIADTATLVVTGRVDEVDVNRIRIGHPVAITSDAFPGEPIAGRLIGISAEADATRGESRAPSFEVRAAFPRDASRGQIRLGMSARMRIEIASNPQAIVVPIEAVRDPTTNPVVQVRDPASGEPRPRQVRLGATQQQGIEILSGLRDGDTVILP